MVGGRDSFHQIRRSVVLQSASKESVNCYLLSRLLVVTILVPPCVQPWQQDLGTLEQFPSMLHSEKLGKGVNSPPSRAMENVGECPVHLEDINLPLSCAKEGSSDFSLTRATATAPDSLTASASAHATTSHAASVTSHIELSKSHWSELVEIDCNSTDDEITMDNMQVFQSLQQHPTWGAFFQTFGYDTEIACSSGEMVVGEKFAEGGQAELFHAHITWGNTLYREYCEKEGLEWVLKVFKKDTSLRQLQSQWPQGYLEWWAARLERQRQGNPPGSRWFCDVKYGTLMMDGRFAFLMKRERADLRSGIDEKMLECANDVGPFSKDKVEEIVYAIARGVDWLHRHDIVHRDIKASNVLIDGGAYYIADFECSIGVVGTGLWRAPEILQACQDRKVMQSPELFTKASDVYSYGMTCYEILTGKFPFQNEGVTVPDVIKGKQPHIPEYVDAKYKDLLCWCWQLDPIARPSFGEILSLLEANSKSRYIRLKMLDRVKVHEGGHTLLGCTNPSHTLALLECATNEANGSHVCKLCLRIGNEEVYHCASCGDFDLHLECARLPRKLVSFLHRHELELFGPYNYDENQICDGCLEDLEGSTWIYRCRTRGCDFHLHARCGKYAETIFHTSHIKHKLLLIFNLKMTWFGRSKIICDGCKIGIRRKELVYCCKECKFNIHPSCALGNLVGS